MEDVNTIHNRKTNLIIFSLKKKKYVNVFQFFFFFLMTLI